MGRGNIILGSLYMFTSFRFREDHIGRVSNIICTYCTRVKYLFNRECSNYNVGEIEFVCIYIYIYIYTCTYVCIYACMYVCMLRNMIVSVKRTMSKKWNRCLETNVINEKQRSYKASLTRSRVDKVMILKFQDFCMLTFLRRFFLLTILLFLKSKKRTKGKI